MNFSDPSLPVIPDYQDSCVTGLVPTLLEAEREPTWIPEDVLLARQVVLLVLDGLGWKQLQDRISDLPTFSLFNGGPITTVAPSTTAAALTSITTGVPPGEHGLIGYRIPVEDKVLNTLRWSTGSGDAQKEVLPSFIQPVSSFGGQRPPVVSQKKFEGSGFSAAHMSDVRLHGYNTREELVSQTIALVNEGEPFIYVYWDGIDQIGHEFGFTDRYEEELFACDQMIKELFSRIGPEVAVFATADHGLVSVGENLISLSKEITSLIEFQSGEARFRWLHARQGASGELFHAAKEQFEDIAWVVRADEVVNQGWLGPKVTEAARSRLGDVALVARESVAFLDAAEVMSIELICRHGSLTAEEMFVPAISMVT
ncbi:MAG TPA: alkaline phosphatase family protein [Acidimicrobiales bacterium]|nr:alkaline phosphatase family protein [Acidimicrobiales bacterium]